MALPRSPQPTPTRYLLELAGRLAIHTFMVMVCDTGQRLDGEMNCLVNVMDMVRGVININRGSQTRGNPQSDLRSCTPVCVGIDMCLHFHLFLSNE